MKSVTTYGSEVAELAGLVGIELEAERRRTIDELHSRNADDLWQFRGYCVPHGRDGGEHLLELRALAGLFLFGERTILWVAPNYDADRSFRRIAEMIYASPELKQRVAKVRKANGEQRIELHDGSRLVFVRPTGARGFSADTILIDGWLNSQDESSVMPALACAANPQRVQRAGGVGAR